MLTAILTGHNLFSTVMLFLFLFLCVYGVVKFVNLWCRCARRITIKRLRETSKKIREVRERSDAVLQQALYSGNPAEYLGDIILGVYGLKTHRQLREAYNEAKARHLPPYGPRAFVHAMFKGVPRGIQS